MDEDLTDADVGRVMAVARSSGLASGVAEELTVEVVRRFQHRQGPAWLLRVAPRTRLDVLTVLAVLRRRS